MIMFRHCCQICMLSSHSSFFFAFRTPLAHSSRSGSLTWPELGSRTCCARKCMRSGHGRMLPRGVLSRHDLPLSHRGRAATAEERVGRSWHVGVPPFNFCRCVCTLCLFGASASFQTCLLCLCIVSEGRKEARASF